MPRGGKAAHVHPDLRYEGFGGPTIDAGDGAKERHLLLAERGDHPLYLFAKARYRLIEVVDVGQYVPGHEGVMSREVPFEGLFERRDLLAQAPLGQLRQNLRVGGAAKERLDHRPPRSSQHPRCNRGELDPGLLQDLLKTLDLLSALLYLPLAVACFKFLSSRISFGGTKLGRTSPYSRSWQIHSASLTSVFLPGTFLRWRALRSQHSKSSSSM